MDTNYATKYDWGHIRAPLIHHIQCAQRIFAEMQSTGRLRGAFHLPKDLAIVTAHNYPNKSLLEKNLDYLGIEGYDVINRPIKKWSHTHRVWWFLDYLKRSDKELVLIADADDVIFHRSPDELVRNFREFDCGALYCSTHFPNGYKNMPKVRGWAEQIHPRRYLNAGVCLGSRGFLIELYTKVADYITETDVHAREFFQNERRFKAEFPRGIGCDQSILRYLEPEYHPRLRIDSRNAVIFRSVNRPWLNRLMRGIQLSIPKEAKQPVKKLLGLGQKSSWPCSP